MDVCIVYLSASVGMFVEEDLSTILAQSQRNNSQLGVTGVMLYVRGSIVQVLEGEKQTVEALYRRIEQDRRHRNVTRILTRPIAERLFGDWTMGYETMTDQQLDSLKTVVDFNDSDESAIDPNEHIILKTIKVFYETNRYN